MIETRYSNEETNGLDVRALLVLVTGATGPADSELVALGKTHGVPLYVRIINPILKSLLRMGIPLSPTVLLTVSGRKSRKKRTTPVVMFELDGRSYLVSFFGESNWVLNLRAARMAALRRGLHSRVVT